MSSDDLIAMAQDFMNRRMFDMAAKVFRLLAEECDKVAEKQKNQSLQ